MPFLDKWNQEFSDIVGAFSGTTEEMIIIDHEMNIRFISYALQSEIFPVIGAGRGLPENVKDALRRVLASKTPEECEDLFSLRMLLVPLCTESGESFGVIMRSLGKKEGGAPSSAPSEFETFSTTVGFILSSLKLIYSSLSGPLDHRQKKYFSMAQQSCFRLLKQIEDFEALQRIAEGKSDPIFYSEVELLPFLEDLLSRCNEVFGSIGQEVSLQCDVAGRTFFFDQALIQKVILFSLASAAGVQNPSLVLKVKETGEQLIFTVLSPLSPPFGTSSPRDEFLIPPERYGSEFLLCRSIIERHGGTFLFTESKEGGALAAFSFPKDTRRFMNVYNSAPELGLEGSSYEISASYDPLMIELSNFLSFSSGVSFFDFKDHEVRSIKK